MVGLTERHLVKLLGQRFRTTSDAVRLGIGDDAAVVALEEGACVASVDASVEGVHFERGLLTFEDVGYRAFQAAVSDLAAMGATPVAALSALILPRDITSGDVDELTRGQASASLASDCPIVGGNISRGAELSVTTTVLGRSNQPLCRSGARAGEQLWVVGSLGLAAAGLACLRSSAARFMRPGPLGLAAARAVSSEGQRRAVERCVRAWRRPEALLARGRQLVGIASAVIDVSDGLAADAWQLARASGVRLVIERARLRAALDQELLGASRALKRSALHFALYGGEDYALLVTGPSCRRPPWANVIGHVTRGAGAMLAAHGTLTPLGRGYDHLVRP